MQATLPDTKQIKLRLDEKAVLWITLNRPAVRNALNIEMVTELHAAFESVSLLGVRVVVIRGAGGNFCAGGDINDMGSLKQWAAENNSAAIERFSAAAGWLFTSIDRAPCAVIAVVEGTALGGAMGLICSSDVVICTADARFGLPETRLGLIPAQVAPFVRGRIGETNTRLMAITGMNFDAQWAERAGLVNYVVGAEWLDEKVSQVVSAVRECAPHAVLWAKRLACDDTAMDEGPEILASQFAKTLMSSEAQEGLNAFVEKRKARWSE